MKLSEELFMLATIFVGTTAVGFLLALCASMLFAVPVWTVAISMGTGATLYSHASYHILIASGAKR